MGPLALVVGIAAILGAMGVDTAPEGTHNIGLLQKQTMLLHTGLAFLVISAIRWQTNTPPQVRPSDGDAITSAPDVDPEQKRKVFNTHVAIAGTLLALVLAITLFAGAQ